MRNSTLSPKSMHKRRACVACQQNKRKCDGFPCAKCVKRGIPCVEAIDRRTKQFRQSSGSGDVAVAKVAVPSRIGRKPWKSSKKRTRPEHVSRGARAALQAAAAALSTGNLSDGITGDAPAAEQSQHIQYQNETDRAAATVLVQGRQMSSTVSAAGMPAQFGIEGADSSAAYALAALQRCAPSQTLDSAASSGHRPEPPNQYSTPTSVLGEGEGRQSMSSSSQDYISRDQSEARSQGDARGPCESIVVGAGAECSDSRLPLRIPAVRNRRLQGSRAKIVLPCPSSLSHGTRPVEGSSARSDTSLSLVDRTNIGRERVEMTASSPVLEQALQLPLCGLEGRLGNPVESVIICGRKRKREQGKGEETSGAAASLWEEITGGHSAVAASGLRALGLYTRPSFPPPLQLGQLHLYFDSHGSLMMYSNRLPVPPGLTAMLAGRYNITTFVPPAIHAAIDGILLPEGGKPMLPSAATRKNFFSRMQARDDDICRRISNSPVSTTYSVFDAATLHPAKHFVNRMGMQQMSGDPQLYEVLSRYLQLLTPLNPVSIFTSSVYQLGSLIQGCRATDLNMVLFRFCFSSDRARKEAARFVKLVGEGVKESAAERLAVAWGAVWEVNEGKGGSATEPAPSDSGRSSTSDTVDKALIPTTDDFEAGSSSLDDPMPNLPRFLQDRVLCLSYPSKVSVVMDWVGSIPRSTLLTSTPVGPLPTAASRSQEIAALLERGPPGASACRASAGTGNQGHDAASNVPRQTVQRKVKSDSQKPTQEEVSKGPEVYVIGGYASKENFEEWNGESGAAAVDQMARGGRDLAEQSVVSQNLKGAGSAPPGPGSVASFATSGRLLPVDPLAAERAVGLEMRSSGRDKSRPPESFSIGSGGANGLSSVGTSMVSGDSLGLLGETGRKTTQVEGQSEVFPGISLENHSLVGSQPSAASDAVLEAAGRPAASSSKQSIPASVVSPSAAASADLAPDSSGLGAQGTPVHRALPMARTSPDVRSSVGAPRDAESTGHASYLKDDVDDDASVPWGGASPGSIQLPPFDPRRLRVMEPSVGSATTYVEAPRYGLPFAGGSASSYHPGTADESHRDTRPAAKRPRTEPVVDVVRRTQRAGSLGGSVPGDCALLQSPLEAHGVDSEMQSMLSPRDLEMLERRVCFYSEMDEWRQDFVARLQKPGSGLGEELTRQILRWQPTTQSNGYS